MLYQGILQVEDPALLVEAIRQGIGRGRSYGCGLISIARLV
ncbi:MAG: type I-E CRISPR-associated protein Cas6/Cse3/CasE [Thermosynechococcaceae cyanobacterium MS004]|nr:type I-E CRISPR-associated protein Cas6/Cse3/CasE [Thermosynechococcaceae cyanobacterium MS004]